jgi:hypothetical protein
MACMPLLRDRFKSRFFLLTKALVRAGNLMMIAPFIRFPFSLAIFQLLRFFKGTLGGT